MNNLKNNGKYLQCKRIDTAINRATKLLIERAERDGIYENFGQLEVMKIKDKFIDISNYSSEMNMNRDKLKNFDYWCMSYTGR